PLGYFPLYYFTIYAVLISHSSHPPGINSLSLHDALPIWMDHFRSREEAFKNIDKIRTLHPEPVKQKAYRRAYERWEATLQRELSDRKSTRLNSSHVSISYAVFCLKKKKI